MNACREPAVHARWLAILRGLAVAALLANFLFAHGCHGDEDHELFTSAIMPLAASR